MGPSILDNMEISMVHVLPADFQSTTSQPSFLDDDVVAEEATQIDFVPTTGVEPTANDDNLKAALAELFPRSSAVNLRHLKPLYVTAHIEGYLVSKIFVDCGATVNIMPVTIMKALHRSNDELIPSGITMSSFVGGQIPNEGSTPIRVEHRRSQPYDCLLHSRLEDRVQCIARPRLDSSDKLYPFIIISSPQSFGMANPSWYIWLTINPSKLT